MTEIQYLTQNLLGFEGDTFARDQFEKIIIEEEILTVIETGTYLGSTTKHFATWGTKVHTIEVNENHFRKAQEALKDFPDVKLWYGNSPEILAQILSRLVTSELEKILFFLDAHWESYNPLLDELTVIANSGVVDPIIAIHDFKVPGHPELEYDSYKGQDYDLHWIEPKLIEIYRGVSNYRVEYNSEATGAKRGVIYIYPKQ